MTDDCAYRDLDPGDAAFLLEMLRLAIGWRPPERGGGACDAVSVAAHVFADLGRPGDGGVVAECDGQPIGACWYRIVPAAAHGHGFAGPGVPELTVAVRPEHRARGVGGMLLDRAIEHARAAGFEALALTVEVDNPAHAMYERRGFEVVGDDTSSQTMRRTLAR